MIAMNRMAIPNNISPIPNQPIPAQSVIGNLVYSAIFAAATVAAIAAIQMIVSDCLPFKGWSPLRDRNTLFSMISESSQQM